MESMGGSAGRAEGHPCSAANFFYDADTGQIYLFSNDIMKNKPWHSGFFRVLVNDNFRDEITPHFFKIIEFVPRNRSSKIALQNVQESIRRYNDYMTALTEKNRKEVEHGKRSFFQKGIALFRKILG